MQYKIELMYTFWNNSISIHLYNIFFYQMNIMLKTSNGQNFFITSDLLKRQR